MDDDDVIGTVDDVRACFEALPVALARVSGARLRCTAANAAFRTLVGRPDLVGSVADPSASGPRAHDLFELAALVFDSGEELSVRAWRLADLGVDGSGDPHADTYIDAVCTPRLGVHGEVVGVDCAASDVTAAVLRAREDAPAELRAPASRPARDEVATALQDALLPSGLPVVAGLDLAGQYLLADADLGVGGDWFDALVLSPGLTGLVVGDVADRGVEAAAVMGQLRAVVASALLLDPDPAGALDAVTRFARVLPAARTTALVVAVVDVDTGTVRYATAGGPPPLLVAADGGTRVLPATGGGPLLAGRPAAVAEHPLRPDEMVVLHTNGLLSRPERPDQRGELARVVSAAYRGAAEGGGTGSRAGGRAHHVCARTLEVLTGRTGLLDDVAFLVAHRLRTPVPPAVFVAEATPDSIAAAREVLGSWFDDHGITGVDALALHHAVGELVANAVEHAYTGRPVGPVALSARLDVDSSVVVEVVDHGRWRESPGGASRGLAMARGFVDRLEVRSDGAGTCAVVRHAVSRPAALFRTRVSPTILDLDPFRAHHSQGALRFSGTLDHVSVEVARLELAGVMGPREGTAVVDLSDLDLLSSAGVRLLLDLGAPETFTVYASAGTPADGVLEVMCVDHVRGRPVAGS